MNGINSDYKITCKLSSNHTIGLGLALHQADNTSNTYLLRVGYGSANNEGITSIHTSISETWNSPNTYVADTDVPIEMTCINGAYTFKINEFQKTFSNPPSSLQYVGLESWNNTKTLTITDFKVEKI